MGLIKIRREENRGLSDIFYSLQGPSRLFVLYLYSSVLVSYCPSNLLAVSGSGARPGRGFLTFPLP